MKEAFANYLREFNKNNPAIANILYYISVVLHVLILPISVLILIFSNSLLLLIALIVFFVGIIWHWEVYGECIMVTIEENLGDRNKRGIKDFNKIYGDTVHFILYYCSPPIMIFLSLYKIYYLKTTCKRR
jgi:hypothetical protein